MCHLGFEHPLKEAFAQLTIDSVLSENFLVACCTVQKAINKFIG